MTYLKFIIPAIVLTGCSMGPSFTDHNANGGTHYGHASSSDYGQSCEYTACPSPYSVSEANYSENDQYYGAQSKAAPTYDGQEAYVKEYHVHEVTAQGYDHGAYQQPSSHAYGTQVGAYDGHKHHHHGSDGNTPNLRGAYGLPKRSYKYATLGASMYDVDSDVYGIQGRVGYQSANLIGAELEAFAGLTSEKETLGATTIKAGVDYTVGAFGVLRSHLSPKLAVHGRAGYHLTDITGEIITGGVSTDVDIERQDGFAYGVGAEYSFSSRDFIRADYTRYDQDLGKNDSVSIAYGRKF